MFENFICLGGCAPAPPPDPLCAKMHNSCLPNILAKSLLKTQKKIKNYRTNGKFFLKIEENCPKMLYYWKLSLRQIIQPRPNMNTSPDLASSENPWSERVPKAMKIFKLIVQFTTQRKLWDEWNQKIFSKIVAYIFSNICWF